MFKDCTMDHGKIIALGSKEELQKVVEKRGGKYIG